MRAKAQYSLNDLAEMVIELHSCVHQSAEVSREIRDDVSQMRTDVAVEFGLVRERVAKLEGRSEAVAQRVGVVDGAPAQKAAWFPKPWQVFTGACGAAGGFVVIWKVAAAVLPALNAAVLAQH